MVVTELGMLTAVRPVRPSNAQMPMVVTELGMLMEVRPSQLQSAKAYSAIPLVPFLSVMLVPSGMSPLYS